MDEQTKNLILATGLSFLVLLTWMFFFPPEPIPENFDSLPIEDSLGISDGTTTLTDQEIQNYSESSQEGSIDQFAPRVEISTRNLKGSIWLKGGRIDDLSLVNYRETLDNTSNNVSLLAPTGSNKPYYATHGWVAMEGLKREDTPNSNTVWALKSGTILTEDSPIILTWKNGQGIIFEKKISVDENYMFEITQSVINGGNSSIKIYPYGNITRNGQPDTIGFYILHEGVVGMQDGELIETNYDDIIELSKDKSTREIQNNGWIGFTDKYWMSTLLPKSGQTFKMDQKYFPQTDNFEVWMRLPPVAIGTNESRSVTTNLFIGAKEVSTIKSYQDSMNIENFVDSVDWGWFFYLTKPIFFLLDWFNGFTNNMGWSIILLTLFIKTLLFPLSYKSFVSMSRMKQLQPQMEKIKQTAGDDKAKLQQELMALYRKEKVNPVAGCLPILLQIPIFFSLYKVLFVTIEMRHAPFIGWIKDLSAPDPTSFLNLFGLLPFSPPDPTSILAIFSIGVYPILMGITMWLQQKLNPAPTDKTQAMIFAWMPWVFMFMLGQFSAGLVIYWVANNIIQFGQQYIIMYSQGVKPDIFGNIMQAFKRSE
ncbi:MAG: membrane protein insertase YidC [Pseudomonadota bacterium]|nr:membrane protein insertase YidC [Pseudomonadota bacterium]